MHCTNLNVYTVNVDAVFGWMDGWLEDGWIDRQMDRQTDK